MFAQSDAGILAMHEQRVAFVSQLFLGTGRAAESKYSKTYTTLKIHYLQQQVSHKYNAATI